MMSQVPTLAAESHDLAGEAGDAIKAGQKEIKVALRKLGVASDISEAAAAWIYHCPPRRPAAGGLTAQPMFSPARPVMGPLQGTGGKVADLVQCLSGTEANDSGWPIFTGKYVEYPRFRKE